MADDITTEGTESEAPHDVVEEVGTLIDEAEMTPDDALAVLLSAKPVRATRKVVVEGREGMGKVQLVLRSLTDREIKMARKASEKPLNREQKRRGEEPEIDDDMYRRLIVANGVQSPRLNNPELLQAHGCSRTEELVGKLFLSGHITILFAKVMEVSGYSEEAVVEVGNG